jgi:hypothetical protein
MEYFSDFPELHSLEITRFSGSTESIAADIERIEK